MKPSARLAPILDGLYRRLRDLEKTASAKHLPRGVTLGDLRVLRAVERVGEQGVSAIANDLGTSQPAATVAVARLEARGLVQRASGASDARRKPLGLTTKGRHVAQAGAAADQEIAETLLAGLPKSERADAVELLARIADDGRE